MSNNLLVATTESLPDRQNNETEGSPASKKRRISNATNAEQRKLLEQQIHQVDQVLANFSDATTILRPGRDELWNNGNTECDSQQQPSLADVSKLYAPTGLEKQFQELYRMLHGSLVERATNASAFLLGSRGSGKSLVMQQCLAAFRDELKAKNIPAFRQVSLHGIAVPGKHVSTVLTEILTQLSAIAFQENHTANDQEQLTSSSEAADRWQELLRLRKTSFTNNLQLLNEILEIASVDGLPVLFVLEELDAFLAPATTRTIASNALMSSSQERQVLLYHLLDRVATQGSFISFVGITSDQGTMERLEKRIRSRAEGTARFIHFGPCPSYQDLVQILSSKCQVYENGQHTTIHDSDNNGSANFSDLDIKSLVGRLLLPPLTTEGSNSNNDTETLKEQERIVQTLQRDYALGKDVRWFCRVLSYALTLYRTEGMGHLEQLSTRNDDYDNKNSEKSPDAFVSFGTSHLLEAMVDMGASFMTETGERELVLVQGKPADPRMQVLCDLTNPQLVLLLAARRILARDGQRESSNVIPPLTLQRMLEEYRTTYKGSSSRYSHSVLLKAFRDLLELDVVRPASDHTGTIPFQYLYDDSIYYDIDANTMLRVPLHVTVDIHRELKKALDKNLLGCSTAVREWGRKTN